MRVDVVDAVVVVGGWEVATEATRSWSCERVAMMVRVWARMAGMCAVEDMVSVGWQWASQTPMCQGKAAAGESWCVAAAAGVVWS